MRSILTWFADYPSTSDNVYSLHNMVAAGLAKYDVLPGEWYGPGTACYVLRDLVDMHERQQQATARKVFRVHVASNGSVYRDVVEELMTRDARAKLEEDKSNSVGKRAPPEHPLDHVWEDELIESANLEWDTALLLLVPLRFGLKYFNEDYIRAVAHSFSLPQSVGVLGGRPRGARWFYGAVSDGSKIFGLDPHTVQSCPRKRMATVNGNQKPIVELSDDYLRSVHTTFPEVFSLLKMDPSVALGFYCRDRKDLESVVSSLRQNKQENQSSPELFTISDTAPSYTGNVSSEMDEAMMANMTGSLLDETEEGLSDEDEYVVL
jgi:cysteine protease ATG4